MKKTLLIYWPEGGNVEHTAKLIADEFGEVDMKLADQVDIGRLPENDLLLVGCSTVGAENWEEAEESNVWAPLFLRMKENNIRLDDTTIAFFGLGDQVLYPDHFVDGMGILKDEFENFGASFTGKWPSDGYEFTGSLSLDGEDFIGLAIDEDQQADLTPQRVKKWVEQVKKETGV